MWTCLSKFCCLENNRFCETAKNERSSVPRESKAIITTIRAVQWNSVPGIPRTNSKMMSAHCTVLLWASNNIEPNKSHRLKQGEDFSWAFHSRSVNKHKYAQEPQQGDNVIAFNVPEITLGVLVHVTLPPFVNLSRQNFVTVRDATDAEWTSCLAASEMRDLMIPACSQEGPELVVWPGGKQRGRTTSDDSALFESKQQCSFSKRRIFVPMPEMRNTYIFLSVIKNCARLVITKAYKLFVITEDRFKIPGVHCVMFSAIFSAHPCKHVSDQSCTPVCHGQAGIMAPPPHAIFLHIPGPEGRPPSFQQFNWHRQGTKSLVYSAGNSAHLKRFLTTGKKHQLTPVAPNIEDIA